MPRQTITVLILTLLIAILASLQEADARVVIKGCPLTGYKREGNHCIFVGCPKGLRKIVRSNFRQRYSFCVKDKPKTTAHRSRHHGFVSPHLILAYVRQRISPCRRLTWLRRRLHRVWKRVKQKEREVTATEEKIKTTTSRAQKAWQQVLAKQRKGLDTQRKLFSLILRKVNIMEHRRGMRLSSAYKKLRWWIQVAKRRIIETQEQLRKYIHEYRVKMSGILKRKILRTEMHLKRWRSFLKKLEFWLMKVIVILRRRRTRRRIASAWRQVRRVKLAIKQVQQKIHATAAAGKGQELGLLIKRETLLWSLLTHRKAALNSLMQELISICRISASDTLRINSLCDICQATKGTTPLESILSEVGSLWAIHPCEFNRAYGNRVRARRIENTLHQIKLRLAWAEKKIAFFSKLLKDAKDKKHTQRGEWIERLLAKWRHYLGRLQKRRALLTKRYEKKTKESADKGTKKEKNAFQKPSVTKSKDDGLDTLRKLMIKKKVPNITIFKFHLP